MSARQSGFVDRGHSAGMLADLEDRAASLATRRAAVQASLMLRTAFKLPFRQN